MNGSISLPLDGILRSLGTLSIDDREWLAGHLMEQVKKEKDAKAKEKLFFSEFLKLPYDNPMSAKEKEKMIRDSHYFDPDRDINHIKYE